MTRGRPRTPGPARTQAGGGESITLPAAMKSRAYVRARRTRAARLWRRQSPTASAAAGAVGDVENELEASREQLQPVWEVHEPLEACREPGPLHRRASGGDRVVDPNPRSCEHRREPAL